MPVRTISGLVVVSVVLLVVNPANAQRFGHPPPLGDNSRFMAQEPNGANANYFNQGVQALQSKNFQVAEGIFEEVLRQNPNHADANFMMGVTKMSLDEWEAAKRYLEVAVRKSPKLPDPKSRLAVTLIKLGDIDGAMKQRAGLEKLDKDCKGTCRNAQWIANGLAMNDAALPPKS